MVSRSGLILYAHGARDPRWAEPFHRIRDRVEKRAPELRVAVAFLEHLAPDLPHAVASMAQQGVERIRIVPMFFGRGGHLRDDMPRQVAAARAAAPSIAIEVTAAAGESDVIVDALARFAVEAPVAADGGY